MFRFPFTNFHELNLDWVLSVVKQFAELVPPMQSAVDDVQTALEDATEAVQKSSQALENANEAITTANEAKEIAEEAAQGVIADGAVTTPKLQNGAVTFAKIAPGVIVHRNLLANWCFLPHALINQRRATVYNNEGYCINGWILGANSSLTVTDAGIILTGTLSQPVELPADTYRATVLTSESVIDASYDQETRIFSITGNNTLIIAAKLETGVNQTLAYNTGSGLKLTEEPEYLVDLEKVGVYDTVTGTVSRANGITGGTLDNVLAAINGSDVTLSARLFGVSYPANGNVLQISEELWPKAYTRVMGYAYIENVGNVPVMVTITTHGEVQINYSSMATFNQFGFAGAYKI